MRHTSFLALSGACCALLTAAASAAHADLTVVSETTLTGIPTAMKGNAQLPDLSKPVASTIYYKGDKMRTESMGTVTIVSGGGTGAQTMTLNPTAKTYFINPSLADALADNPFASMMTFTAEGSKVEKTTEKKTLLSKEAGKYDIAVPLKMGDFLTINITGEEWTADSVALPPGASGMAMGALGKMMAGPMSGGLKEVTAKMAAIKGLPLLTVMTMNFVVPDGSPLAAMQDSLPKKMTVRNEVKSVSEVTISDDLFIVPAGYKKVDAPAAPGFPGAGGDEISPAPAKTAAPVSAPPAP